MSASACAISTRPQPVGASSSGSSSVRGSAGARFSPATTSRTRSSSSKATSRDTTTSRSSCTAVCSIAGAIEHLEERNIVYEQRDGDLWLADPDERAIRLLPHRPVESETARWPQHARASSTVHLGGPRRLGHVNHLTGDLAANEAFYVDVLGMQVSDRLGEAGVWFHIDAEHHVLALVDLGYAHFHHLAFDVVDIGKMRDLLDHLARHGRWVAWGPTRHGIAGNIATYVRIVEEPCFVELYCDMELLAPDHEPRVYPDDRYSSNTWGPLPPRSYFRFDPVAVESERESWETRGRLLPPPEAS